MPPRPPDELGEVVVEAEEVDSAEAVVEVEDDDDNLEVPGSMDLEPFFLLKNGFVAEILLLCYFHPFGTWDG